jgi:hypothetical protein
MLTTSRGYTSKVGSKSTPTPATNTSIRSDELVSQGYQTVFLTSGTHANRWRREDLRRLAFVRWNSDSSKLTKATSDRTSSAPMPAPRMRPSQRKKTTIAKATHRTLMAMRALRAGSVMGTYIMAAMMEKTWSEKGLLKHRAGGFRNSGLSKRCGSKSGFHRGARPPWESLAILNHSSRAGQREACLAHRGMVTAADNHPPRTEFRSGGRVPKHREGVRSWRIAELVCYIA